MGLAARRRRQTVELGVGHHRGQVGLHLRDGHRQLTDVLERGRSHGHGRIACAVSQGDRITAIGDVTAHQAEVVGAVEGSDEIRDRCVATGAP